MSPFPLRQLCAMYDVEKDTIVAIATPHGRSALGIVRLSGDNAISLADTLFVPSPGSRLSTARGYTMHQGCIISASGTIDEVVVGIMRSPRSYTGEDMVEIYCHGNPFILQAIVKECITAGARPAGPGEFTKRAFCNGRIDLSQAEAVAGVINARSSRALSMAQRILGGELGKRIETIRKEILEILVPLEASIEFPEEAIAPRKRENILKELMALYDECHAIRGKQSDARALLEGIRVTLAGSTNAGKSSLFNRLLEEEKAIVTDEHGTTRDCNEVESFLDGHYVRLIDTAGIGDAKDKPSIAGIQKSRDALICAQIVVFVVDRSIGWTENDDRIATLVEGKEGIVVCNKMDLKRGTDGVSTPSTISGWPCVEVSALTGENCDMLRRMIADKAAYYSRDTGDESMLCCSMRQAAALEESVNALEQAVKLVMEEQFEEICAEELKRAVAQLDSITGGGAGDNLLDRIFSQFCIGK